MSETFKGVEAYAGNKHIKAYENGRNILDIILNDYDVNGAIKVLEALGYRMTHREY